MNAYSSLLIAIYIHKKDGPSSLELQDHILGRWFSRLLVTTLHFPKFQISARIKYTLEETTLNKTICL